MEQKPNLGNILQERFNINSAQWQECLSEQEKTGTSLVRVLIDKELVDEDNLLNLLSGHLDIPYIRIQKADIDKRLLKTIPAKIVTHYNFMPLNSRDNKLKIAVNDPLEILLFDEIGLFLNKEIQPVIASQKDIAESIKKFYGVGAVTLEKITSEDFITPDIFGAKRDEDIKDETLDPSVIKFLNQVLLDAIKHRATDIHFEPFEDELRIRYRIDGVLYDIPCPAIVTRFRSSIASRVKIMADLDITEKRRPQDGRIKIRMGEEVFDLRISILPTPFGGSIGIRILSRNKPLIDLKELGFEPEALSILEKEIHKLHGIILVTGPTGSGKTTTLYTCLSRINSPQHKILTIEDPIEYQLKGVTQIQIKPKIGLSFAEALRSMLRHDPDVMMVGEIRDVETAELAVRTALTGHLVFSTLHTNNAASSITRLLDMGIDDFLVSSSVNLVIAQRLIRLICPHCKQSYIPSRESLKQFGRKDSDDITFYHGSGCEKCRFTGYQGRTGIFEMLVITEEIKEMILKKLPSYKISQKALSSGMKILAHAGWDKVRQGITTIEEVLRVTQEETY